ncbi:hypothetical protein Scel_69130 [Streptomyces cellostaticus]|nr:hypothetical protein Scel_69130 [Streptomyces cellostaticus]
MHEENLAGLDTQQAQLCGDGVASDKRAGRRGYGHGSGVFPTGLSGATEIAGRPSPNDRRMIDQKIISAGQIRYA